MGIDDREFKGIRGGNRRCLELEEGSLIPLVYALNVAKVVYVTKKLEES